MAKSSWANIIRTVQTPLGFLTLCVLVCEGILAGLALRASGTDFTVLIWGFLLVLVIMVVLVSLAYLRERKRPEAGEPVGAIRSDRLNILHPAAELPGRPASRYDVFLSSVLAGFHDDVKLQQEKQCALAVATCLERECNYTVYYAGRDVGSFKDFDPAYLSARADIDALKQSRYFLLVYPEPVVSSVLFEAGIALDHCEASIYFVRNLQDLPNLMRRLAEAVGRVKACVYQEPADIVTVLKRHRKSLFEDVAK
jgi:hypothetical protein